MTLAEKRQDLLATLSRISNPQERFSTVVQRGRQLAPLESACKTDLFRVEGCLTSLWFVPEFRDGKCYFRCDAESVVVRAIAGLLCDFYSGYAPEEILEVDPAFLAQVGLTQHLSTNRRNSLSRLWEKITEFASAHRPPAGPRLER